MSEIATYEGRHQAAVTITKFDDADGTVTTSAGWTVGVSPEVLAALHGAQDPEVVVETVRFSQVVGWMIDGAWVVRQSDQEIKAAHDEWVAQMHAEQAAYSERHREEWTARTAALPDWMRARIEHFLQDPEFTSQPMGWGYELIVAELAVMYLASGGKDTEEINAFANKEGTSGNQHGVARVFARMYTEGERTFYPTEATV